MKLGTFYLFSILVCLLPVAAKDIRVPLGNSIQTAIDAAVPGDTITLDSGATYVESLVLRYKGSSTSYITIRSSAAGNFPAGVRVSPGDAPLMAKIVASIAQQGRGAAAIQTEHGAHHYRLSGLEITSGVGDYSYDIVRIGLGDEAVDIDLPANIDLDHLYIHGDPIAGSKRGVAVNGKSLTITDSYISDITSTWQDAQAICGWNGPGPITITNNYLEATGENVMFGGAPSSMPNLIPSNIVLRGNYLYKPTAWRNRADYVIKNLFELKNARNVLLENNILDGCWGWLHFGTAIVLTPRTEYGAMPWAVVDGVTLRYNIVRNAGRVINMAGLDDYNLQGIGANLTLQNNLFYAIDQYALVIQKTSNITVDHNTILAAVSFVAAAYGPTTGFVFNNNITAFGQYGLWGDGASTGSDTLNVYFPGSQFKNNALVDGRGAEKYYPPAFFPSFAEVGFTNPGSNDYSLSSSSPFLRSGTDGKPLGADVATITANTAVVPTGRPPGFVPPTPSPTPPPPGPAKAGSAAFVRLDTATKGQWRGVYGGEGYSVIGDQTVNPASVNPVTMGASTYIWTWSTTDPRALQKASNPADRIAGTSYAAGSFSLDLNFNDQASHQFAVYCVDWESAGRQQKLDVLDVNGNVLNTQILSPGFGGGVYVVWNVSGHVIVRVTQTGTLNSVISGFFFGTATQPQLGASATFVKSDTTTQGNWRASYGADGYVVVGDQTSNPGYVTPLAAGPSSWTWIRSTADPRALQKSSNPADRIASTWYSYSSFTVDLNFTDQAQHQFAVYSLDWDTVSRRQTLEILDAATNTVLNTQTLNTNFSSGIYTVWTVSGHVKLRVTSTGGINAVVSGLFFGGSAGGQSGASATFVKSDTTTKGNWRGIYGADGYVVVGYQTSNPGYVTPLPAGQSFWTWIPTTTDARALQKSSNPADRIASTWYSSSSFTVDLNFTDQAQHQFAVYSLDWDTVNRRQTLEILDAATNAVLNAQPLNSNFSSGVYTVWTVSGHVKLRVTSTGGLNAVISGLFFR